MTQVLPDRPIMKYPAHELTDCFEKSMPKSTNTDLATKRPPASANRSLEKNRRRKTGGVRGSRRGVAAVEFAVIAPVMILFTFGLIEIGRISMVKDTATHATREGARAGIRPNATNQEVQQRVQEELAILGIDSGTVTVTPNLDGNASPDGNIRVAVTIPIASISWIPNFFSFGVNDVVAETSMRRESTQ